MSHIIGQVGQDAPRNGLRSRAGFDSERAAQPSQFRAKSMLIASWWRITLCSLICAVLLAVPNADAGQTVSIYPTSDTVETAAESTTVEFDGYALFSVRGGTPDAARQRAQQIAARIEELARDSAFAVDSLRIFDTRDETVILAGKQRLLSIFDLDVSTGGLPRVAFADTVKARISQAILDYRAQRTEPVLLTQTAHAAGATVALVAVLAVVTWGFRRLNAFLERRYKTRMKDVEIRSFHIIHAQDLWSALRGAVETVHVLLVGAALLIYLQYVLDLYPWTRPFGARLLRLVMGPLETLGTAAVAALPNLMFILILILIVRYLLKMMRLFFGAVAIGRVRLAGFEPEWAFPTYKIIRLFAIAFALAVAYPYIPGSGSDAFKGVTIFLGLVVSLGSTSIIGNLIAGYAMTYRRAFRIGDRIGVQDTIGDVIEMRLLETHLRSIKNEEIVVPNTIILSNQVTNYSALAKQRGLILHTRVGIGYEVSWRQVEAMLLLAAQRTEGLLRQPPPFILKNSLGNFCVEYELNVYTDDAAAMPELYSRLHENILDIFNAEGVQIMTPAYVGDPVEAKIAPPDPQYTPRTVSAQREESPPG